MKAVGREGVRFEPIASLERHYVIGGVFYVRPEIGGRYSPAQGEAAHFAGYRVFYVEEPGAEYPRPAFRRGYVVQGAFGPTFATLKKVAQALKAAGYV